MTHFSRIFYQGFSSQTAKKKIGNHRRQLNSDAADQKSIFNSTTPPGS